MNKSIVKGAAAIILSLAGLTAQAETVFTFHCGSGAQAMRIETNDDRKARLIIGGRDGVMQCALHLEKIEGEFDSTAPGNALKFDFAREQCTTVELTARVLPEIVISYFDFWKPDAQPAILYERLGGMLGCRPVKFEMKRLHQLREELGHD